jgi:hypothetical protein
LVVGSTVATSEVGFETAVCFVPLGSVDFVGSVAAGALESPLLLLLAFFFSFRAILLSSFFDGPS